MSNDHTTPTTASDAVVAAAKLGGFLQARFAGTPTAAALEHALLAFLHKNGLDTNAYLATGAIVPGQFDTGDIREDVAEIVLASLPVTDALAGTSHHTAKILEFIRARLKAPPQSNIDQYPDAAGASQAVSEIAQDMRRLTSHFAPRSHPGHKGHRTHPPSQQPYIVELSRTNTFTADNVTFFKMLTVAGGSGGPYRVAADSPDHSIAVLSSGEGGYTLVATRPHHGRAATAILKLIDHQGSTVKTQPVAVEFAGPAETGTPSGLRPTLTPVGNVKLDGRKDAIRTIEFTMSNLPSEIEVYMVLDPSQDPPSQPPPVAEQQPIAWSVCPADEGRRPRLVVYVGVAQLPTTQGTYAIQVFSRKGHFVTEATSTYSNPAPQPNPKGFASQWVPLGSTITVVGDNLGLIPNPVLTLTGTRNSPIVTGTVLTVSLKPVSGSLQGMVPSDAHQGVYAAMVGPYQVPGTVTLAAGVVTATGWSSISWGDILDQGQTARTPVNGDSVSATVAITGGAPPIEASLVKVGDPDSLSYTVTVSSATSTSMTLAIDSEILADPGTYALQVSNSDPANEPIAGTSPPALTLVVAPPSVTAPSTGTFAARTTSPLEFWGGNFLMNSTVTLSGTDAKGGNVEVSVEPPAPSFTSSAHGTLQFKAPQNMTNLVLTVVNPANADPHAQSVSSTPKTIAMTDPGGTAVTPAPASLVRKIAGSISSHGHKKEVLEEIREQLVGAGCSDDVSAELVDVFGSQLAHMRHLHHPKLEEAIKAVLAAYPHLTHHASE
jgi:hypothetical protein